MRLRKLKYHGEGSPVYIEYDEHNDATKKHDRFTFECEEPPRDALAQALQGMGEHALDFCGMDADAEVVVKSVSISYDGNEVQGLIITASVALEGSKGPFNFNTPRYVREGLGEDDVDDEPGVFSEDCAACLDKLEKLAFAYIGGDRAQLELALVPPETDMMADSEAAQQPQLVEA